MGTHWTYFWWHFNIDNWAIPIFEDISKQIYDHSQVTGTNIFIAILIAAISSTFVACTSSVRVNFSWAFGLKALAFAWVVTAAMAYISVMRGRILQPFSFMFLLLGEHQYHLILETLDTEEATYIWYSDKNRNSLIETIKHINSELNITREKGRQAYLETNPTNFSRIVHDYSDSKKGFIVWKDVWKKGWFD